MNFCKTTLNQDGTVGGWGTGERSLERYGAVAYDGQPLYDDGCRRTPNVVSMASWSHAMANRITFSPWRAALAGWLRSTPKWPFNFVGS